MMKGGFTPYYIVKYLQRWRNLIVLSRKRPGIQRGKSSGWIPGGKALGGVVRLWVGDTELVQAMTIDLCASSGRILDRVIMIRSSRYGYQISSPWGIHFDSIFSSDRPI
jgi:hypothetical protein